MKIPCIGYMPNSQDYYKNIFLVKYPFSLNEKPKRLALEANLFLYVLLLCEVCDFASVIFFRISDPEQIAIL